MGITRKTFQGDHFGANLGTGHALTSMIKTPNEANSERQQYNSPPDYFQKIENI